MVIGEKKQPLKVTRKKGSHDRKAIGESQRGFHAARLTNEVIAAYLVSGGER